jgi:hypothetical protein
MMRSFVYILSPSYSGSTLLTILLARHPRIATIGEMKATSMGDIAKYQCSCGTLIGDCPFFSQLRTECAAQGAPFELTDFGTHYRRYDRPVLDLLMRAPLQSGWGETVRTAGLALVPGGRRTMHEIARRNRVMADAICKIQNADVLLDGSKEPNRFHFLMKAGFPDPHVIHIVRDGRANANSALGHGLEGLDVATREWRDTHAQALRVKAWLPADRFLTLRYEDLCASPDEVVAKLFRFIGVDPAEAHTAETAPPMHILGNSMRLKPLTGIQRDERWRRELSSEQLARFDRLGGDMNRRFGYV